MVILIVISVIYTGINGEDTKYETPAETAQTQHADAPTTAAAVPEDGYVFSLDEVPEYSGELEYFLNGNVPLFTEEDLTTESFETYSELDELGRCRVAYACVGEDIMPTEERGSISHVKPTGWVQNQYDFVNGKSLYNRCHLIAHQLTGEDANWMNLITGTRTMNEAMIPYENMVADYVRETGEHVLYRVTPIFDGDELVARGVQMEALSVEDNGESVCFHVFLYNVEPGVVIDYATGENWEE
ncbi:MAG: DNA/RNA non-specific endonuclease [Oscillospiraceae bacterium]|nr:DNA/RNA non-specific endonuclease [Oscillospiraceae bacterium]